MRRLLGGNAHPYQRTSLASRLSRLSLWQIVGVFLLVTVGISLLAAAVPVALGGAAAGSYPTWLRHVLRSPAALLEVPGQPLGFYLAAVAANLAQVVLPVLLLGAFVFKLFQRDPLQWRQAFTIEDRAPGGAHLCFRFYNRTTRPLVGLKVQVFARVTTTGSPSLRRNLRLDVVQAGTRRAEAEWAYSPRAVPFSVWVPLGEPDDTASNAEEVKAAGAVTVQGQEADKNQVRFVLLVTGTMTDHGGSFFSSREYLLKDAQYGHFQEIDVKYDGEGDPAPPHAWAGWEGFEETCNLYVFGYGSLASASSLGQTLGREVGAPDGPFEGYLRGYRREWNVGADHTSHPERSYVLPDGREYEGVVAWLGVVPDREGGCNGAVFKVSNADLGRLDRRERNYDRIEVTESVTWAGKPDSCAVFTYVPKEEAIERLRAARAEERAAVRTSYLSLVEAAFSGLSSRALGTYRDTTPQIDLPALDLHLRAARDASLERDSA